MSAATQPARAVIGAVTLAACVLSWQVSARPPAATPAATEAPPVAPRSSAQVRLPHAAPQERPTAGGAVDNAACERCHADVAREWRGSWHQRAGTDPAFLSQVEHPRAHEPAPFCRSCHAPEAPLGAQRTPFDTLGVACVSCHSVGGQPVLAAPSAHAGAAPQKERPQRAPHPLLRTTEWHSPAACAGCHEFPFPETRIPIAPSAPHVSPQSNAAHVGARSTKPPLLMQETVQEHRDSPYAAVPCADCHMPFVDGPNGRHRDHRFRSVRDPLQLRAAVRVESAAVENGFLVLKLRSHGVGHAFPTGDVLRRLTLRVEVETTTGEVRQRETRYLTRHFGTRKDRGGRLLRVLVADTRLTHQLTTFRFTLRPRANDARVRYALDYERVIDPTAPPLGSNTPIAAPQGPDAIRLVDGELALLSR